MLASTGGPRTFPPLVLHCSSLFSSRLAFGESRISKPRSTCFSRHNANTGFCLRLPETEGGRWVRTLQQSEELPEGLSLLRLPGSGSLKKRIVLTTSN